MCIIYKHIKSIFIHLVLKKKKKMFVHSRFAAASAGVHQA